jgi:hypothetical protein
LKAVIAALPFAIRHASMEHAMQLHVSMEYVMIPHSLVTVTAASKALIAAFLFVIHHVSMEHAMKLLLPFTCDCADNFEGSDCSRPICSPACVNGVCNAHPFAIPHVSMEHAAKVHSFLFAVQHVSMEYAMLLHSLVTVKQL